MTDEVTVRRSFTLHSPMAASVCSGKWDVNIIGVNLV